MKRDGVFQRLDCEGWYVSYVDADGKRRKQRVQAHTRTQARDVLAAIKTKVQKERILGVKEQSDISTKDLFDRYERHQSDIKSLERTKQILQRWREVLPAAAREITREHIDKQVAKRRTERASPATISKEITILKHCLRLAVEDWALLHKNAAIGVKLPKVDNGRLRYLTPDELKKALHVAPEWMRAPLALAAFTGCRRGELLALRWNDVNLKQRVVFLPDTKNGEAKAVPLNSLAIEVLEYLPKDDELVLPGVDGPRLSVETKRLFKRQGIKDASFHTLRHTAASWLVMQGADLYSVGQLLGHKTLKMTKRYAHLSPGYMQATVGRLDTAFKGVLPEVAAGD
jgi:integrase